MELNIKKVLKNMTINSSIFVALLLFSGKSLAQKNIVEDLNMDGVNDTLIYKCEKTIEIQGQPFCIIEIKNGKCKKNYKFNLHYVNWPLIDTCGPGCISLFDDGGDTEYNQEYNYSKKYDDWILTRDDELLKYEDNKEVNKLSDQYLIGITGKKYRIKEMHKKR